MSFVKPQINKGVEKLFQQYGKRKILKSKQILIHQGQISQEIFLLKKGLLRYFYSSEEGKEITRVFLRSPDVPLVHRFTSKDYEMIESLYSVETIGKCEVLSMSFDLFERYVKGSLEGAQFYIAKLEEIYLKREISLNEQQTDLAKNNYLKLKEYLGDDLSLVNSKTMATYLNISAESLSRLKKTP